MEILKNILAATDCSEESKQSVLYATNIAKHFNAKLTIINVINPPELIGFYNLATMENKRKELDIVAIEQFQQFWDSMEIDAITPELVQIQGDPFYEIINYAKKNRKDVIIITTHGKSGLKQLMIGSVADKIVRYSPIPVITVKLKNETHMQM